MTKIQKYTSENIAAAKIMCTNIPTNNRKKNINLFKIFPNK